MQNPLYVFAEKNVRRFAGTAAVNLPGNGFELPSKSGIWIENDFIAEVDWHVTLARTNTLERSRRHLNSGTKAI